MLKIEHKRMTMKSLVEDLEKATGGNKEDIQRILIEHKVVHSFSVYRYMVNIKVILEEKEKEISEEIKQLKEETILLGKGGSSFKAMKVAQKLERVRGKRDLLIQILTIINYYYETILSKMDKEEGYLEKIEESAYKEIGRALRKRADKIFK